MESYELVIPCLLGLEGPVAEELKKMDAKDVRPQNGRVKFAGSDEMLARANICSRYGERVLIDVGSFKAESFEELFQGVKKLPWERFIGRKDAFPVKGSCVNSKLMSVPDCQSIIKKAVVERLKQKYSVNWFEETETKYQIQFLILKDTASIMIDTTGVPLHKRGYRANSTAAPIKETLAAAMVYFSRVRHDANFIDPMCGSGTILIEAALYALNIAPGIKRRFAAESWKNINKNVWNKERQRARDLEMHDASFIAHGYDIDQNAVELSSENALKAGVKDRVIVENRNISDFREDGEYGCVICNPPYGERLLDMNKAQQLYTTMGRVFNCKHGWSFSIISPDGSFEQCFGRKADKRRKLYNGMIKCQYYMYFK